MNKITYPLKKGDKGLSVVNLQDALFVLLEREAISPVSRRQLLVWKTGLASERTTKTYGTTTSAIVSQLQQDQNIQPDGDIGPQTTVVINKLLHEWGIIEHPIGPENYDYNVQGHINQVDNWGSDNPVVGFLVKAFDRDLRHEEILGETVTDRQGYYNIGYSQTQFMRAEKQSADLIVRVYKFEGRVLLESDIIFNAQSNETIDFTLSERTSEYDHFAEKIIPILDGIRIKDLNEADIVFLTGETEIDNSLIIDFISASKLADSTGLSNDVHYGLIREGLPKDLNALLHLSRDEHKQALQAAVIHNYISNITPEELDQILDHLHDLLSG